MTDLDAILYVMATTNRPVPGQEGNAFPIPTPVGAQPPNFLTRLLRRALLRWIGRQ